MCEINFNLAKNSQPTYSMNIYSWHISVYYFLFLFWLNAALEYTVIEYFIYLFIWLNINQVGDINTVWI